MVENGWSYRRLKVKEGIIEVLGWVIEELMGYF